jgi:hypothetical protein
MDENVFLNDEKEFTLNRILSISSGLQGVLIMLNARFMIESIVKLLITCLFLLSYLIIFILMPRTKRNYLSFILSFLFFVCVLIFVNK